MKGWINIRKCRTKQVKAIHELLNSNNLEDRSLGLELKSQHKIHNFIDDETVKFLKFCSEYYEYVGIRTQLPIPYHKDWGIDFSAFGQCFNGDYQNDKRSKIDGWPAIWGAAELVGIRSCGNSHQYQINNRLTKGLYMFKNNQIYVKI